MKHVPWHKLEAVVEEYGADELSRKLTTKRQTFTSSGGRLNCFFRWVKQVLRIKHFLGVSENAVRIQIAVTLIAFLLMRLAQATQKIVRSPLHFVRLIRANLMHRRAIDQLLATEAPIPINPNQLSLGLYCA